MDLHLDRTSTTRKRFCYSIAKYWLEVQLPAILQTKVVKIVSLSRGKLEYMKGQNWRECLLVCYYRVPLYDVFNYVMWTPMISH